MPSNLADLAQKEAGSLAFWFRREYGLAPTDPRFLDITPEEIAIEYEAVLCSQGNTRKECPLCGMATFRPECPNCTEKKGAAPLTGDMELDAFVAASESGNEEGTAAAWARMQGKGEKAVNE